MSSSAAGGVGAYCPMRSEQAGAKISLLGLRVRLGRRIGGARDARARAAIRPVRIFLLLPSGQAAPAGAVVYPDPWIAVLLRLYQPGDWGL